MSEERKIVLIIALGIMTCAYGLYLSMSWVAIDDQHQHTARSCIEKGGDPAVCARFTEMP